MIQLRPSGAYGWTRCAAKPTFEGRLPKEPDSDAAREGTCAAWVADQVLKGIAPNAASMIGRRHENAWIVTPDMADHVQGFVDLMRSHGGTVSSEQHVRLTDFIAGTYDGAISGENTDGVLRTKDLKYGMMIVEVFDNPQLLIYTAAELLRLGTLAASIHTVELAIYQPRAFHPDGIHRKWTMTVPELWERIRWIIARGEECQKPNPVATPGPQCDFCTASTSCAAIAHTIYAGFRKVEDVRQRHMTAEELAAELTFLTEMKRLVEARQSAVETEARLRMDRGEHIRGWHIKEQIGNRIFTTDPITTELLTGKRPTETKEVMLSPAELERRGAPVEMVAKITRRPTIGFKLVKMPNNAIEKAFSK